jgi:hypothetical protein
MNTKLINTLRVIGSFNLIFGYFLIAGTPFKAVGIGIRISAHLCRLPYSFKHSLRDFIGFHGIFTIIEIFLFIKALRA